MATSTYIKYIYPGYLGRAAGKLAGVKDGDDVDGDERAGDDVHGHDLAMQVPEAGQQPVDNKGEEKAQKTEKDRERKAKTDKDRQRQTKTDKERQRQTKTCRRRR